MPADISLKEKVEMVEKAESGAPRDYIRQTFDGLKEAGVDDQAVTAFWQAVKRSD